MKAGLLSVDITPPLGIVIGGNGREDSKARGVHDNLRANIVILDNCKEKVLFIGLDLLAILGEDCEAIKSRVEKETGIKKSNITINATHTHSGPNVIKIFMHDDQEIKDMDRYRIGLIDAVARGVSTANDSMFECRIGFGRTEEYNYSFNRRVILKDGSFKMVFEDYDPGEIKMVVGPASFPDLNIFKVTDCSGNVRGVIVNYTTHLTTLCGEGLLFSRDFVNYFSNNLQEKYGKEMVVLYANGSQGNLTPSDTKLKFITGFDESARVGNGLADTAKMLIDSIEVKDDLEIRAVSKKIRLPLREITEEMKQNAINALNTAGGQVTLHGLDPRIGAKEVLELAKMQRDYDEANIQAVQLGDTLIVTFPGEVFIEFGIEVINKSPFKNTVIFGLANDFVGYIPIAEAFSQGGYEIKTARSSRLTHNAGNVLVKEVLELVRELEVRS